MCRLFGTMISGEHHESPPLGQNLSKTLRSLKGLAFRGGGRCGRGRGKGIQYHHFSNSSSYDSGWDEPRRPSDYSEICLDDNMEVTCFDADFAEQQEPLGDSSEVTGVNGNFPEMMNKSGDVSGLDEANENFSEMMDTGQNLLKGSRLIGPCEGDKHQEEVFDGDWNVHVISEWPDTSSEKPQKSPKRLVGMKVYAGLNKKTKSRSEGKRKLRHRSLSNITEKTMEKFGKSTKIESLISETTDSAKYDIKEEKVVQVKTLLPVTAEKSSCQHSSERERIVTRCSSNLKAKEHTDGPRALAEKPGLNPERTVQLYKVLQKGKSSAQGSSSLAGKKKGSSTLSSKVRYDRTHGGHGKRDNKTKSQGGHTTCVEVAKTRSCGDGATNKTKWRSRRGQARDSVTLSYGGQAKNGTKARSRFQTMDDTKRKSGGGRASDDKKTKAISSERALQICDARVRLSKTLSWLLRHSAEDYGLTLMSGGYLPVEDVLRVPGFRRFSICDIKDVVVNDNKNRFRLVLDYGSWKIKANSGHTISISGVSGVNSGSHSSGRYRRRRPYRRDRLVTLSRSLARILRHTAINNSLKFMKGGFLYVDDLLKLNCLKHYKFEDVKKVVDNDEKTRFTLIPDEENSMWMIRANGGHSLPFELESPVCVRRTKIPVPKPEPRVKLAEPEVVTETGLLGGKCHEWSSERIKHIDVKVQGDCEKREEVSMVVQQTEVTECKYERKSEITEIKGTNTQSEEKTESEFEDYYLMETDEKGFLSDGCTIEDPMKLADSLKSFTSGSDWSLDLLSSDLRPEAVTMATGSTDIQPEVETEKQHANIKVENEECSSPEECVAKESVTSKFVQKTFYKSVKYSRVDGESQETTVIKIRQSERSQGKGQENVKVESN